MSFLFRYFSNLERSKKVHGKTTHRELRIESLETRELLSVNVPGSDEYYLSTAPPMDDALVAASSVGAADILQTVAELRFTSLAVDFRITGHTVDSGGVTLNWTEMGSTYEYFLIRNGVLIVGDSESGGITGTSFTDDSDAPTKTYYAYARDTTTLQLVSSSSYVVSEATDPTLTVEYRDDQTYLSWYDQSVIRPDCEFFYVLFRNNEQITEFLSDTSYIDTDASDGVNTYVLYVYNHTNPQWTTSQSQAVGVLSPPNDPQASAIDDSSLILSWTEPDATTGADGYRVDVSTDGADWTTLYTVPLENVSCHVENLEPDTRYFFRISTVSSSEQIGSSAPITLSVSTLPEKRQLEKPANLAADSSTEDTITLTWNDPLVTVGIDHFLLEWSYDGGTIWSSYEVAVGTETSTPTGLTANTSYQCRITSIGSGDVIDSEPASTTARTTLVSPVDFRADTATLTEVVLKWTVPSDTSGIAGYKIERSIDGGTTWDSETVAPDLTEHTVSTTAETSYLFRIRSVGSGDELSSATSTISVTTPRAMLDVPEDFVATLDTADGDTVDLVWKSPSDPQGVTGYRVEWIDASGSWDIPATVAFKAISGAKTLSTRVSNLSAGVYRFRICSTGDEGTIPNGYAVWQNGVLIKSDAPTDFAVVSFGSDEVSLSWTVPGDTEGIDGYRIEYVESGGDWTIANSIFVPGPAQAAAVLDHLAPNTAYDIRITVVDAQGNLLSGYNELTTVRTALAAPFDFAVREDSNTSEGMVLIWSQPVPSDDIEGYRLEWIKQGEDWTDPSQVSAIDIDDADKLFYTVGGLVAGRTYEFRIRAVSTVTGTVNSDAVYCNGDMRIAAPTNAGAVADSAFGVSVSWTVPYDPNGIAGYRVEYIFQGDDWTVPAGSVAVDDPTATMVSVTGLPPNAACEFRVRAVDASGELFSHFSNAAGATTLLDIPTNLTAETSGADSVRLKWTAGNQTGVAGYVVEYTRATDTDWSVMQTRSIAGAANTATEIDGLAPGTQYMFRVRAVTTGEANGSGYSNEAVATTTFKQLASPTSLQATADVDSVQLGWTPSIDATGYVLRWKTENQTWDDALVAGQEQAVVGGSTVGDTVDNLFSGTRYEFRIIAVSTASGTVDSEPASFDPATTTTRAAAPTNLSTEVGAEHVVLTWIPGASNGVASFRIKCSTDDGDSWTTLNTIGNDQTTYTATTLVPDTPYLFRVVAVGDTEIPDSDPIETAEVRTRLVAPTDFTAGGTATTVDGVTLVWTSAAPATGITGYEIEYALASDTDWSGAQKIYVTGSTTATERIDGLDPNMEYKFRLRAVGMSDAVVENASEYLDAGETTLAFYFAPAQNPAAVAGIKNIRVSWDASTDTDVNRYVIQCKTAEQDWDTIPSTQEKTVYVVDFPDVDFSAVLNGLLSGTAYEVRVIADGDVSGTLSSDPVFTDTVTPTEPPTGLWAPEIGATTVQLNWTPQEEPIGVAEYEIQYKTTAENWDAAVSAFASGADTSTFVVHGLTPETEYEFRIRSIGLPGIPDSAWASGTATATTKLAGPTDLTLVERAGTVITLSWTAPVGVVPGEHDYYYVSYRYTPVEGAWSSTPIGALETTATLTMSDPLSPYLFKVTYVHSDGTPYYNVFTSESNELLVTTGPVMLEVPGNPTATTVISREGTTPTTSVELSWTCDNYSHLLNQFNIWYGTNGTEWTLAGTIEIDPADPPKSFSFEIEGLDLGTVYFFRIEAVGDETLTVATHTTFTVTMPILAPTNLAATPRVDGALLTWEVPDAGGGIGYWLEWIEEGGDWEVPAGSESIVGPEQDTFDIPSGLISGTTYHFRIRSFGINGILSADMATAIATIL